MRIGFNWSVWVTFFTAVERRRTGASAVCAIHRAVRVVATIPASPDSAITSHSEFSVVPSDVRGRA